MTEKIQLKKENFICQLKRKRGLKSLRLSVQPSGQVTISAPYFYPKRLILRFVAKKADWLREKLINWQNTELQLISQKNQADYLADKEMARSLINSRLQFFNSFYNFNYNQVRIKNQKSSWGSCSKNKNLNFNFRLLYLSAKMRDYIIVHELCHLRELNHSSKFWQLVSLKLPDYKKTRKELRGHLRN